MGDPLRPTSAVRTNDRRHSPIVGTYMANVTKLGPWAEKQTTEGLMPPAQRFREHAASLRRVARTIASASDKAALESAALSYERSADEIDHRVRTIRPH